MTLVRAFTKRMKQVESLKPSKASKEPTPAVPSQTESTMPVFDRSKISLPVALVSTTNMLSYNAPNLPTKQKEVATSPVSSVSSADDSDHSVSGRSRASSHSSRHTTLTDASSVEGSPTSPPPNHLSGFFPPIKPLRKSVSTTSLRKVKEEITEPVPALPTRAISHSKSAHQKLAQKRSLHNLKSSSHGSISSFTQISEQRISTDTFVHAISEEPHPFGKELQQLNEVVEELSGTPFNSEAEADLRIMRSLKLATFCAADYLAEIQPLFASHFGIPGQAAPMAWI